MNTHQVNESRFAELDLDTSQLEQVTNIENLNETVNALNQAPNPANNVIVLTKKDNIVHNYFHYFDMYWDARDCLSSVILKFPKTEIDNTKYWLNYHDDIMIFMGSDIPIDYQFDDLDGKTSRSAYLNLQNVNPIFQGEIGYIKEYKNELEVHVDSIGKRFKQKIPEEFRQSYINGQNVRDAFQAICEFLGVKYICPPPTTTEATETDGTENDVSAQKTAEDTIANVAKEASNQAEDKQSKPKSEDNTPKDTEEQSDESITGQLDNNTTTDNTEVPDTMQNGYADISFDGSGAIVHGSVAMEVGIDITDTLLTLEEHPLDKYLPEEEYDDGETYLNDPKSFVVRDVRRLLGGEFFDTVHNNVMDYGSITIAPGSATTSDMSSVGDVNGDGVVDEKDVEASNAANTGSLTKTQLYTAISEVVNKYYPRSTAKNDWIIKLRDCDTTWSRVASIVNQMGGDKDKQNKVISEVLGYKKRYHATPGVDRHHSDGLVTSGYISYSQQRKGTQQSISKIKNNRQSVKKAMNKMGIGSVTHWI